MSRAKRLAGTIRLTFYYGYYGHQKRYFNAELA